MVTAVLIGNELGAHLHLTLLWEREELPSLLHHI